MTNDDDTQRAYSSAIPILLLDIYTRVMGIRRDHELITNELNDDDAANAENECDVLSLFGFTRLCGACCIFCVGRVQEV